MGHIAFCLIAVLRIRDVLSRIRDVDPTIALSRIRIPDPGGKKALDPGSGFATLFDSLNLILQAATTMAGFGASSLSSLSLSSCGICSRAEERG
jgi:hypothetical protein